MRLGWTYKQFASAFSRWLIAVVCLSAAQAASAVDREAKLRAAFLYRLAFFVEWPAARFASAQSPIMLCIAPDTGAELVNELSALGNRERKASGAASAARKLQVRALTASQDSADCHLLYGEQLEPSLSGRDRLLVVGTLDALKLSGGLALVREQRAEGDARLVFFAHKQRLHDASIKLSSKLLQLVRFYEPS